jgi:hypothetical protein
LLIDPAAPPRRDGEGGAEEGQEGKLGAFVAAGGRLRRGGHEDKFHGPDLEPAGTAVGPRRLAQRKMITVIKLITFYDFSQEDLGTSQRWYGAKVTAGFPG